MKKSAIFFLLFFLALGSSFVLAQVKIESNKFLANTSTPGYTLNQNTGDRSVTIEVAFDKPFDKKPTILLTVTLLDADTKTNIRYSVEATSISRDGFTLKISTWSDSKISGIGGNWVAYSE